MERKFVKLCTIALVASACLLTSNGWSQQITRRDKEFAVSMLQEISPDIQKHFYDPKLHGVDWNAQVAKATQKIKTANSRGQALGAVASVLLSLNDSHTFLLPPAYAATYDYGWQAQMIGDRCFVVRVRPGSDADKQGVKPGDELLAVDGFTPDRESFWKMQYVFKVLSPRPGLVLELRDPAGQQREVSAAARTTKKKGLLDLSADGNSADTLDLIQHAEDEENVERARFSKVGEEVGILKLPSFSFDKFKIDGMISKARKYKALVLDLRGNSGGYEETLQYLVGVCFDKDVKIADRVSRSEHKPLVAKNHYHPFTGKLVVLVDSKSASAAELFARVIQIEKRGTVIGDRSSGSVMEAKRYSYKWGTDTVIFYGASITDADLVMTDGKSLEHNGVLPDESMLPSAQDLAAGRDPVLAHAVELAGGKLTPEAAGKLFPYEWPEP